MELPVVKMMYTLVPRSRSSIDFLEPFLLHIEIFGPVKLTGKFSGWQIGNVFSERNM